MSYSLKLHIDTLQAGIRYYENRGENPTHLKKELKKFNTLLTLTKENNT